MKRFWKDCKGAVTVFVTLLLIPAVLISGTAVDLARIYTARSVVQDGNQLAANSILTQYDALLQDLYGLFGVAKTDPELAVMVDEYIQTAIFGEKWQDRGLGTFQLFYGSDAHSAVTPKSDKHLKNEDVIRRQIEEYMKYRGPVIIVQKILDKIEKFKTVKKDAEVIEQKIELDESLDDLFKTYKDLKNKIDAVNEYKNAESRAYSDLTSGMRKIQSILSEMKKVRNSYTSAFDADNTELANDLSGKYDMLKRNLSACINGGSVYSWVDGDWNDEGEWEEGYSKRTSSYSTSESASNPCLKTLILKHKKALNEYSTALDELVTACEKADNKKEKFKQDLQNLKNNLNGTSPELKEGLVGKDGNAGTLNDEAYKVLEYNTRPMAEAMRDKDKPHISSAVTEMENAVYGINLAVEKRISLNNLSNLSGNAGFDIDLVIRNRTISPPQEDKLSFFAGLTEMHYRYTVPTGFEVFQSEAFNSTKNKEFYEKLSELINQADNSQKKKDAENSLSEVLKNAKKLFDEMRHGFSNDPEGALEYTNSSGIAALTSAPNKTESGFESGDMDNKDKARDATKDVLGGSILTQIGDLTGEAADKILLLTYDIGVFSCYTTTSSPEVKTISGIPMGTDVNYYFQSEQEYLFNGNIKSAEANLNSVTTLLFVVRFVFNYVSSFSIDEINGYVNTIRAVPYVGPLLAELARIGFALAESAIDVGVLRAGRSVPIIKDNVSWRFSMSGAVKTIKEIAEEVDGGKEIGSNGWLYYGDYVCIFLLFVNGDDLAARTSNLISLNVTNKKNNVGAKGDGKSREAARQSRQTAMASTALCNMADYHTDFKITTTVDLGMLFLSMPFAQKGVKGIVPPKTMEVTVTDYRGY